VQAQAAGGAGPQSQRGHVEDFDFPVVHAQAAALREQGEGAADRFVGQAEQAGDVAA